MMTILFKNNLNYFNNFCQNFLFLAWCKDVCRRR